MDDLETRVRRLELGMVLLAVQVRGEFATCAKVDHHEIIADPNATHDVEPLST